jgi:hypothetical protein
VSYSDKKECEKPKNLKTSLRNLPGASKRTQRKGMAFTVFTSKKQQSFLATQGARTHLKSLRALDVTQLMAQKLPDLGCCTRRKVPPALVHELRQLLSLRLRDGRACDRDSRMTIRSGVTCLRWIPVTAAPAIATWQFTSKSTRNARF